MRVLFIRPNQVGGRSIPIGMTILQAHIKKAGHAVKIFDTTYFLESAYKITKRGESLGFFFSTDMRKFAKVKKCDIGAELLKIFHDFKPDIVAFSLMSNDIELTIRLAQTIKKTDNNIPIILGGIQPTIDPEGSIKLDCVDLLCIGEGEEAFVELLDKMEKKEDYSKIKNIWRSCKKVEGLCIEAELAML